MGARFLAFSSNLIFSFPLASEVSYFNAFWNTWCAASFGTVLSFCVSFFARVRWKTRNGVPLLRLLVVLSGFVVHLLAFLQGCWYCCVFVFAVGVVDGACVFCLLPTFVARSSYLHRLVVWPDGLSF